MTKIYAGNIPLNLNNEKIEGQIIEINNNKFYKISNYDQMPPFFMTITSDSDHWMFLSSNGGLTCGRKDRENALFPYYTDDKIHDSNNTTGPISIFLIEKKDKTYLWEPFTSNYAGAYQIKRNLYKSILGNEVIFEEINESLQVKYSYAWKNTDKYGFIKESKLSNLSDTPIAVQLIDGLRNILPYGVTTSLQANMSTLVDGYKKCELLEAIGLGIYSMSSILTDRAEPSEALKTTVVWSHGIKVSNYLFSEDKIKNFKQKNSISTESSLKGRRGSYLLKSEITIAANASQNWMIVAEVNQNHSQVIELIDQLKSNDDLLTELNADVEQGSQNLKQLIASADGIQKTGDELSTYRHLSNTMFNIMRGGIYFDNYKIPKTDFVEYIQTINSRVVEKHTNFIKSLHEDLTYNELIAEAKQQNDADLERICMEYLPLTFSRRHGDPSRPWNFFQIDLKTEDGQAKLNYQGNWRDIFQNWEALSYSYPQFIEGIITKFVNASTADGYNPYRITKNGIDWEILDLEDPWSNIGYWGDHQIIYLQKLLEASSKFNPDNLNHLLSENLFTYANVPYRIKAYTDIVSNPYDTIEYDDELETLVAKRFSEYGADGKLIFDKENRVYKVNLTEKLLVPLLAKLSNFVPHGGIWLNTQRPEWNDANNALVGYGLSMVTVYYMRRYMNFLKKLLTKATSDNYELSIEVSDFFDNLNQIFTSEKHIITACTPSSRKSFVDQLGNAATAYRNNIYKNGFSGKKTNIKTDNLLAFLDLGLEYIDATIRENKKDNGLYHSYNLIGLNANEFSIHNLNDMLEGQVAVLSSGLLKADEVIQVLDALKKSEMYRADQKSYMLYPNRELPQFLEKNNITAKKISGSKYLLSQIQHGNKSIVEKDKNGIIHFNGTIKNANQLKELLEAKENVAQDEIDEICKIYFELFNHREFTGRSGTFFKYEGLGSIYWHMVSKLVLAIQENYFNALTNNASNANIEALKNYYFATKEGLGVNKNPADYGAFPTDPYSHTPEFAGVQQPGMTGQVKEDFMSRFAELGIHIEGGQIKIIPTLLNKNEFIKGEYLEFTYCATPIKYQAANKENIQVLLTDGNTLKIESLVLSREISTSIFNRDKTIKQIIVSIQ